MFLVVTNRIVVRFDDYGENVDNVICRPRRTYLSTVLVIIQGMTRSSTIVRHRTDVNNETSHRDFFLRCVSKTESLSYDTVTIQCTIMIYS
jgi:hypothetical protein